MPLISKSQPHITVTSPPGYLDEGLFGRVFLWIFEVLPALKRRGIYPQWEIQSALYGRQGDNLAVPGIVDLAYSASDLPSERVSLVDIRNRFAYSLGADWTAANSLWTSYFSMPDRVTQKIDGVLIDNSTLGVHYRGTDKIVSYWDSNEISSLEMLTIVKEFLADNPDLRSVFLTTDQADVLDLFRSELSVPIVNFGVGEHHKTEQDPTAQDFSRSDQALVDCLALSRCGAVLLTSSALSAFSKVFNPSVRAYRCAASKMLWDGPYFPVAYIPVLEGKSEATKAILARTMRDDWTSHPKARRYLSAFHARPNWAWRRAALRRGLKRRLRRALGMRVDDRPVDFFHW